MTPPHRHATQRRGVPLRIEPRDGMLERLAQQHRGVEDRVAGLVREEPELVVVVDARVVVEIVVERRRHDAGGERRAEPGPAVVRREALQLQIGDRVEVDQLVPAPAERRAIHRQDERAEGERIRPTATSTFSPSFRPWVSPRLYSAGEAHARIVPRVHDARPGRGGTPTRPRGRLVGGAYSSVISTRRFLARPSFVLLLTIGFDLPQPFVVMRWVPMPRETM